MAKKHLVAAEHVFLMEDAGDVWEEFTVHLALLIQETRMKYCYCLRSAKLVCEVMFVSNFLQSKLTDIRSPRRESRAEG
jgi:hypothetical protein